MNDKTEQQLDFEAKVQAAAKSIEAYDPHTRELVDLIAIDMFSGGNPEGFSRVDNKRWADLPAIPIYTRGDTTYPAKLQWRIKAARIVDIVANFQPTLPAGVFALAHPSGAPN